MNDATNQSDGNASGDGGHQQESQRHLNLLCTLAATNGGFYIIPPIEVQNDPSCLAAEDVIEQLSGTTWRLRFQDGSERALRFPDFMILLYNLEQITAQIELLEAAGIQDVRSRFGLRTTIDETVVMQPTIVRELLRKTAKL